MKLLLPLFVLLLGACSQKNPEIKQEKILEFNAGVGVFTGSADFGVLKKTESKILTFKISNTGDASLIGPPSIDNSNFQIVYQQSSCGEIKPKQYCSLKVAFDAKGKATGQSYSANLNLDSAFISMTAQIEADQVITAESSIQYLINGSSPTILDFGVIGQTQSSLKTIFIKNLTSQVINSGVTISPEYSLRYDTCSNKALSKGGSCQLKVNLSGAGKNGTVLGSISYNGKSLDLTGEVTGVVAGEASGTPNVVGLHNNVETTVVEVGSLLASESKQIVLNFKNKGTSNTAAESATLNNSNFSIAYNQCVNKVLAPNSSCQVRLIFSSVAKSPNTYSGILSFGLSSITLNAQVQESITYEAVYSDYGPCSASLACSGSGTQSRTISDCKQLDNGVEVGSVDISNCSSFAVSSNLDQACQSPAGQVTVEVTAGSEIRSCEIGQTLAQSSLVSLTCDENFTNVDNQCVQLASYDTGFKLLADVYVAGSGTETTECAMEYSLPSGNKLLAIRQNLSSGDYSSSTPITSSPQCSSTQYRSSSFYFNMQAMPDSDGIHYLCVSMTNYAGVRLTLDDYMMLGGDCSSLYYMRNASAPSIQTITSGTLAIEALNPESIVGMGNYLYATQKYNSSGEVKGLYRMEITSSDANPYSLQAIDSELKIYSALWKVKNKLFFQAESGSGSKHFVYDPATNISPTPINLTCPAEPCSARGEKILDNGDLVISVWSNSTGNRFIYKTSDLENFTLIGDVVASGLPLHEPFEGGRYVEELNGYLYYYNTNNGKVVKVNLNGGPMSEINLSLMNAQITKLNNKVYLFTHTPHSVYTIDSNQVLTQIDTGRHFMRVSKASNFFYLTYSNGTTYDIYKLNSLNDSITLLKGTYHTGCSATGDYDLVNPLNDNFIFDCYNSPTATPLVKSLNKDTGVITDVGPYRMVVSANLPFNSDQYYALENQKRTAVYKGNFYMSVFINGTGNSNLMSLNNLDQPTIHGGDVSSSNITVFKDNLFMGLNLGQGEAPSDNYELYKFYQP